MHRPAPNALPAMDRRHQWHEAIAKTTSRGALMPWVSLETTCCDARRTCGGSTDAQRLVPIASRVGALEANRPSQQPLDAPVGE